MNNLPVAIYARVSSEQQTQAQTIQSQIAALRERVTADGATLFEEHVFLDDGYSGTTLLRPALERLRDLAAAGGVERLYVHSPDRLARKYAYQVLLLEELGSAQVEIVFLNHATGPSPEEQLLVQVQGMVAEYERAKILERSRRGKRHAAQTGQVSVLSTAAYGYRYVTKREGGGEARLEIVEEEARVVRQIFAWVGVGRVTIGEVCRRLTQAKETTRTGKNVWDRSVVWGMLKNPVYWGQAAFGKTRVVPLTPRLRAQRNGSLTPRRAYSIQDRAPEEWIPVAVPALVSAEVFAAVGEQLQENRLHARQTQRGAKYLLQGLVVCSGCGYAFYGKAVSLKSGKGQKRDYAYYRCLGTDAYRFGGERVCSAQQVRTDLLETAVWEEVGALLANPGRLEQEYQRRLDPPVNAADETLKGLETTTRKLRQGLARLIDSYAEGVIEKGEFEPRVVRLRERIAGLELQGRQLQSEASLQAELRLIVGRLEDFASQVKTDLAEADWNMRREIIRALVKRVEVGMEEVKVVFRVGPDPFSLAPDGGLLPDCRRRNLACACQYRP
jgi:site-specific DNA recombinase